MSVPTPGQVMLKEIHEQPVVLTRLIEKEAPRIWEMTEKWHRTPPRFIFFSARGTSDHAALYAKYLFETVTGIPVGLASPSISSIYKAHINATGGLFILISQSGEAADVITVIEEARRGGAETLAITNVLTSPMSTAADQSIELHAEPELAVAATKTFTSTMAVLAMIAAGIARDEELFRRGKKPPDTDHRCLHARANDSFPRRALPLSGGLRAARARIQYVGRIRTGIKAPRDLLYSRAAFRLS